MNQVAKEYSAVLHKWQITGQCGMHQRTNKTKQLFTSFQVSNNTEKWN